MEWISWRASLWKKRPRPSRSGSKRIGCRCLFPKSPPLQEGRGLNQTRRWLCDRLWQLQIMRSWKDFAYSHCSWVTGREVLRSHVYWQIMMKGAVLGHLPRRVDPYGAAMEAETPGAWFEVTAPFGGLRTSFGYFQAETVTRKFESRGWFHHIFLCGLRNPQDLFFSAQNWVFFQLIFCIFWRWSKKESVTFYWCIPQVVLFQFYFSEVVPCSLHESSWRNQRLDKS